MQTNANKSSNEPLSISKTEITSITDKEYKNLIKQLYPKSRKKIKL
jgi:hypothetical protein